MAARQWRHALRRASGCGYAAQAEATCAAALQSAHAEDFSDLDSLGFLSMPEGLVDKQDRQVVIVAAKLFPGATCEAAVHRAAQLQHPDS